MATPTHSLLRPEPSGTPVSLPHGSVVLLVDVPQLLAERAAWDALAAETLEPNPFYESWMLVPALESFKHGDVKVLLVYVRDPARSADTPVLGGLFPLEFSRHHRGFPLATVRLWRYQHCFLCTPLLHAGYARQSVAALLEWLIGPASRCRLLDMNTVPACGQFHQLLIDELRKRRLLSHVSDLHTRAMLYPRADAETYLRAALNANRRRGLRRREKQLAELGSLSYVALAAAEDPGPWIEQFLHLEASGWKGRQGSALACSESDSAFFWAVAQEASARQRLMMLALRVDGRPIAMRTGLMTGRGLFFFKKAFDEAFRRYSPGVLLDAHLIRQLHETKVAAWADSCTGPDNAMLNELMLDRRTIQNLLISTGKAPADLAVTTLPVLRWVHRKVCRGGMPTAARAEE